MQSPNSVNQNHEYVAAAIGLAALRGKLRQSQPAVQHACRLPIQNTHRTQADMTATGAIFRCCPCNTFHLCFCSLKANETLQIAIYSSPCRALHPLLCPPGALLACLLTLLPALSPGPVLAPVCNTG